MKLIENETRTGTHVGFNLTGEDHELRNCKATDCVRDGIRAESMAKLVIKDCEVQGGPKSGSDFATTGGVQYAHALMLGRAGDPSKGVLETYIDGFDMGGLGPPSSDYGKFNKDGICVEGGCMDVYAKDVVGDGFSDGAFDFKGQRLFIKNSVLRNAQRVIRIWSGVCYIANTDLSGPCHIWLGSPTAKVIYQKSTVHFFNGAATVAPVVQVGNGGLLSNFQGVDSDPLTGIDFFKDPLEVALERIAKLEADLQIVTSLVTTNAEACTSGFTSVKERLNQLEQFRTRVNQA